MGNRYSPNEITDIAPFIHQAALFPHSNNDSIKQICDISRHLNFSGLCTNLNHLPIAREKLGAPNTTKLISVISFPFGFTPHNIKLQEAEWAAEQGAEQLDVVPNFFALAQGKENLFAEELAEICNLGLPITVIIDLPNLSPEKISLAVEASIEAGVYAIQSCNGFGPPVTTTQIRQLSELVKNRCAIKAVGGIKTIDHALEVLKLGATFIGTTNGANLVKDFKSEQRGL